MEARELANVTIDKDLRAPGGRVSAFAARGA
jgi:hypothetical protein